jgi:ribosomal protein L29
MLGKRARIEFQNKLDALGKMNLEELRRELADTESSLKQIRWQKRVGAIVSSLGHSRRTIHNLRIYKRAIQDKIFVKESDGSHVK